MINNELVMIPCPDLKSYPEAPEDQSQCELFDCPECNQKMWLSQKKKGVIMFCSGIGKNILLACYPCMKEMIENDRSFNSLMLDAKQVDI